MGYLRTILFAVAAVSALICAVPSARAAPDPSPGCGPDTPRLPAGKYTEALWPITQIGVWGKVARRTFAVHVPPHHTDTARDPPPLVIDLHGSNLDTSPRPGEENDSHTLVSQKGTAAGFIVALPDSLPFPTWAGREGEFLREGISDVGFIAELLNILSQKLCFDRNRIFVSGPSNGGSMAAVLACEAARNRLGTHKIAAIAPVAMAPGFPWSHPTAPICPELREAPVPTRVIVSNKDEMLALVFLGNVEKLNATLRTTVGTWARDNSCTAESQSVLTGNSGCGILAETVNHTCTNVSGGRADTVLDIFDSRAEGCNGHAWPGGSPGGGYPATDVILKFFLDHPR